MDNKDKPTCGPLFLSALELFTNTTSEQVRIFSAGHITGQCEKVYLGACKACMIRPSETYYAFVLGAATNIASIYSLMVSTFENSPIQNEIWIHRPENKNAVASQLAYEFNSPPWHDYRGYLCGIPFDERDPKFHERVGYGLVCDMKQEIPDAD